MFKKGVAVIGSTTIDENITQAGMLWKIGGVTTYSGITYRRHGIATSIISNIAPKDKQITATLEKEKITVCSGSTTHTTHFINEISENARRQKIPFQSAPIKAVHIEGIIEKVSCIHLGSLHPMDIDPAVIEMIKLSKLPIVLDVQGYTRRIEGEDVTTGVSQRLSSVLKISQIFKANEHELEAILRFFDFDISGLIKTYNIEECVVTHGEQGGFVQDINGNVHPYEALQVDSIADPTGAGDVFLAAYMLGRFLNKLNIADACIYAAKLSAEQVGGKYITNETLVMRF